jgi:hypothetical protein
MVSVVEVERILPRENWPTTRELKSWLKGVLVHTNQFEYYAPRFDLGEDLQRPHDMRGPFSKLDPRISLRMALQDREDPRFQSYVQDAIQDHGKQDHHNVDSYGMRLTRALDAVCSRMEIERENYQTVVGSPSDVRKLLRVNGIQEGAHFLLVTYALEKGERPVLDELRDNGLVHFPNIGLEEEVYSQIQMLMGDTVTDLRENFGYTRL